ncbi:GIY-YIG nuclease family protein [Aeromonas jandaei]|uniref:GIY-YIG nuclease family protein n=1 Tax=Aeromonas jandaei TaxID=650 RepID=UPI000CE26F51|nr:GIY-YIG nuclease family protein [Aeromonas jandaei]PPA31540.1 hypothetical protein C3737_05065 [Aeromonas jandaei]
MKLFNILSLIHPDITEVDAKVHIACWNGEEHPLDVYFAGEFETWQSRQNKRNFERKFIISLIELPQTDRWLFAGAFTSNKHVYDETLGCYFYDTTEISSLNELNGRLVISFKRSGRASYLLAENWADNMHIEEMLPARMAVQEFKAYNSTSIDKTTLEIIVSQKITSWRTALSSVSGIYLITDKYSGKLYVGSATGEGGFWQRWSNYAQDGHGGNKELIQVLREHGPDYAYNFQYSILEIADTHSSNEYILERESYWKNVLFSRKHGYNAN